MTCPHCGATVQPHDYFCMSCGHALNSGGPTRQLDAAATPAHDAGTAQPTNDAGHVESIYGAGRVEGAYGSGPAPQRLSGRPAQPPLYRLPVADPRDEEPRWASGSSFPTRNPYTQPPTTFSPGTVLNGRPVGRRNSGGSGLMQGLVGLVVALGVILGKFGVALGLILGKFGAALAAIPIFKVLGFYWVFGWIFHGHSWLLLLFIVLIIGALMRSRSA